MKFTVKLFMLPLVFLLVTIPCTAQKGKQKSKQENKSANFYTNKEDSDKDSYTTSYTKGFDEIVIQAPLDLEIVESGDAYIRWSGSEVMFRQEDKKLIITGRKGGNRKGKVYIGNSKLSKIWVNGSGDTNITNHKTKKMEVVLNGSGDVTINTIRNQSVDAKVNGSGDLKLIGDLKQGKFTVNGSGEINATKVNAEKVDCYVNGSGTIKIHAAKYVDGKIWGSGQIEHPNLKIEQKNIIISSGKFKAKIN